ncbi:MAG: peptide deformylase [Firmicutes bacterium]|nr:peptide deformylase [Bacillota bacterium]
MAIRRIRFEDDPILRKISKPIENINNGLKILLNDMAETLKLSGGIGIAAVQVGVLKRVIIAVDNDENNVAIINPEIIEKSGEQESHEGCLSVRNIHGVVIRPAFVKVKGLDVNGKEIIVIGEKRMANVLSHEIDHLDGILFTDKMIYEEE